MYSFKKCGLFLLFFGVFFVLVVYDVKVNHVEFQTKQTI